ncbi:T9SS-dependent M36 family metallopeptidase [Flavobacterium succinicans]|uniref:Minor extracellular protease vpr n=1 Tax=Flavobacterium succinicans TaxID=29536 RepID=A0A199XQN8_9FLAO|nr:T9SS-dependent M36 family metallopeptidase [Flavobacterium succinicans]OAZ03566.1 minor extracellular protease vpr precursor [Flavobacterium succinicans]
MKKTLLFCLFIISVFGFSQSNKEIIQRYLNASTSKSTFSKDDFSDWVIQSDGGATTSGIKNCYVVQRYKGIEIFNAVSNFSIKNNEVIAVQQRAVSGISKKANTTKANLSVTEGLRKAYSQLGIVPIKEFELLETTALNKYKVSNGLTIAEPVLANLVYHQTKEGNLILAWDYTIHTPKHDHIWSVRIDADNGNLLEKNDFVISCSFDHEAEGVTSNKFDPSVFDIAYNQIYTPKSVVANSGTYRVLPFEFESPNHGPFKLLTNVENATASPFGWHDTNGAVGPEHTITRGNNVWAKEDFNGTNSPLGYSPDGGPDLKFDFLYGGTSVPAPIYIDAATTNLFYMNNIMHDVWYQYGFDEVSGNFQANNYGKGGIAGDFVIAEAQDGSQATEIKLNNANFSTPVDGTSGRMQMYLWDKLPQLKPIKVNSPASIAGVYIAKQNSFNPGKVDLPVAPNLIQSDLVLYLDSVGGTSEACVAPSNAAAMTGKIVVVRRGGCNFVTKTLAAQTAGATAVIVVNNVDGEITMSGADVAITIPSISVTKDVGELLINQMAAGAVNLTIQLDTDLNFVNADGDFDNGIIAHEYGHGISTRLAGGSNNSSCLNNADQMGEGWSDWFALMMQIKAGDSPGAKRGIGTFVSSEPIDGLGIRSYPYSTDRSINPMTFATTNNFQYFENGAEKTSVHGVGSVWATILWDLSWAYINKYGFDANKYNGNGGNNKVMKIVLDGIKLQPCQPTFVEARDAIIRADQLLTGGQDFCMIWEVFAARGLGLNASSGDRFKGNDQTEDFTRPANGANCTLAVNDVENLNVMSIYPNPTKGGITIKIDQYSGLANIQVLDFNGRVVLKLDNQQFENQKQIDLSSLQSGMYLIKVTGVGLDYVEKVIVK